MPMSNMADKKRKFQCTQSSGVVIIITYFTGTFDFPFLCICSVNVCTFVFTEKCTSVKQRSNVAFLFLMDVCHVLLGTKQAGGRFLISTNDKEQFELAINSISPKTC